MHPHAAMQHQPLSQQPEAGTHFQISRFGGGTYCGPEVFGGGATSTPAPHLPSAPPLPPFLGIRFGLALPFSSLTVPSGGSSINTSSCSLSSSNSSWSSCFSSSLCSALTSLRLSEDRPHPHLDEVSYSVAPLDHRHQGPSHENPAVDAAAVEVACRPASAHMNIYIFICIG